ncbi:MAG: alpha/beta hydrolase [Fibrobacteres bacterium]|nr:alpha/beta hydrolase [Fibrobacterota bacterium]
MVTAHGHIEAASFRIPAGRAWVDGDLSIPADPKGLVVFASGSGATRNNPRDQKLAAYMNEEGYAALLLDLLTSHEESVAASTDGLSHDIPTLAQRLIDTSEWLTWNRDTSTLKVGYFGTGIGAAAALIAAAGLPSLVQAVVCLEGRPDLAGPSLPELKAPTLLIAASRDESVLQFNRSALEAMTCERSMEIIPGAGHRFEETGALDEVARLSRAWFDRHLAG